MRVADALGIDPIVVLTETDPVRMSARIAAANYLIALRDEQNKKKR